MDDYNWKNLPILVNRVLFSYLDNKSKLAVRQVCSDWKEGMDKEGGLRHTVDSRNNGNLKFIRGVKIIEAHIKYLDESQNIFGDLTTLKKVVCTGILPPQWLTSELVNYHNLTHLALSGVVLHSQDLQKNGQIPLHMPTLRNLEFIATDGSYPTLEIENAQRIYATELRDRTGVETYITDCYKYDNVVIKNVSYLLTHLHAPRLRMAQFYISKSYNDYTPPPVDWRGDPLDTFLNRHQNTLQELYLPLFGQKRKVVDSKVNFEKRRCPQNLVTFDLSLWSEKGIEYWTKFLADQKKLMHLKLGLNFIPFDQILLDPVLKGISSNCQNSLTYIWLVLDAVPSSKIDCSLLKHFNSLNVLKIDAFRGAKVAFTNFSSLPPSLKKIWIPYCALMNPNPHAIFKLKNLEILQISMSLEPAEQSWGLIKAILKLRSLCWLYIHFNEQPGEDFDHLLIPLKEYCYFSSTRLGIRENDFDVCKWDYKGFNYGENGKQHILQSPQESFYKPYILNENATDVIADPSANGVGFSNGDAAASVDGEYFANADPSADEDLSSDGDTYSDASSDGGSSSNNDLSSDGDSN